MCQHVFHGGQVFATPGELSKVLGGVESSNAPNTKARWTDAYAASTSAPLSFDRGSHGNRIMTRWSFESDE
jgi:hypothetical protein